MSRPGWAHGLTVRLSLPRRLALLVAVAVALGITLASTAAYVSSRQELQNQLDATLLSQATVLKQTPLPLGPSTLGQVSGVFPGIQLVGPSGQVEHLAGLVLPVNAAAVAVAQGHSQVAFRSVTVDDQQLRMVTVPYGTYAALELTVSLNPENHSLARLAAVLVLVSLAGVALAISAGLAVTRAGLSPLRELTAAVERVGRDDDLGPTLPLRPAGPPDEVTRLASSFNDMLGALAASRARQRQLVADASHELRTPLTSLRTNVELLARSERSGRALPAGDRAQLLADVTAQTEELASLIGELTLLARDEAPTEAPVELDLADLVAEAVERVRRRAGGITLHVELTPTPLVGRPGQLERAVLNLLDNAVKFSPPGGEVYVGLRDGQLLVVDQGPGVPPEDLPHVFERFYRSPAARGRPGSGLGLAIVADAAAAHGASVSLEPALAGGTTARLRLARPGPDERPS